MTSYRSDIDGLRAIAVLSVVLFHFNNEWLPGGFVGVDIFFVISGYLITGNIYKDLKSNNFSFYEFYSRRIKRIIPAASLVILVTLIIGHFILVPEDLIDLSISALASQLSVANIYFTYFLNASYFAPDAEMQPLLHFWSLGVEEQFYLFWPILLLILFKRFSLFVVFTFTALMALSSFVYAQYVLSDRPMFAYYMLPTRAGQLLIGAICFFISLYLINNLSFSKKIFCALFGWLGLLGVIISWLFVSKQSTYPGVNAVIPTVSAGLIILFSPYSRISCLLSTKPLVFVGLISYSMYLWHWPILVFSRYIFINIEWYWFVPYLIVLVFISWFSWKYVEQVFRKDQAKFRWVFIKQYVLPSLFILCISVFYIGTKGVGFYNVDSLTLNTLPQPAHRDQRVCQEFLVTDLLISESRCQVNSINQSEYLLWGDSNAAHFVPLFSELASEYNFGFRNIAHSACPPLLIDADKFVSPSRRDNCISSINVVKESLENYPVIILSAAWGYYYNNNSELFSQAINDTLEQLSALDKQVLIVGRMTVFPDLDTKCIHKKSKVSFVECDLSSFNSNGVDELSNNANEFLKSISNDFENVNYIDFNQVLCGNDSCSPFLNDFLIYYDSTHLSISGSTLLGKLLLKDNFFQDFFENHTK